MSTAMPNLETTRKISNPTVLNFSPSIYTSILSSIQGTMCCLFLLSGTQLIRHTQPSPAVQAFRALKPKLLGVAVSQT